MQTFDAIVLGMGAMGAATTYQLAKRGVRVLGIDQYDPPHRQGSTHGETRVTRIACGEGVEYAPFARRSHEIWKEIERELGIGPGALLTQNGMILIAGPGGGRGHGISEFLTKTFNIAANVGITAQQLNASDIRARYPQFKISDIESAYFDDVSGFVRPEACVMAQLVLARRYGASTRTNEKVTSFEATGDRVRVTTDRETYEAGRLIVTAGPWLPQLLGTVHPFVVQRQVLYWFAAKNEAEHAKFAAHRFPVFIWLIPRPQPIYGFPALGRIEDGIKIATEEVVPHVDPDRVDRTVSAAESEHMYETYVRPFLPGLSGRCVRAEVCLYTMSDNQVRFIIDRHPAMENVIVASPCSGHGFKHSAAIGETLALMTIGEPHLDIAPFAFDNRC